MHTAKQYILYIFWCINKNLSWTAHVLYCFVQSCTCPHGLLLPVTYIISSCFALWAAGAGVNNLDINTAGHPFPTSRAQIWPQRCKIDYPIHIFFEKKRKRVTYRFDMIFNKGSLITWSHTKWPIDMFALKWPQNEGTKKKLVNKNKPLFFGFHVSNEKHPGCLDYTGDYTPQFYGDYNRPLQGSLLNNQDSMESKGSRVFSWLLLVFRKPWQPLGPRD